MRYIICLITFITSFVVRAQDLEDISLKHSMKQDGLSMQFTVLDPDKKGVTHYETEKIYYWYKAQKVLGTQGGSSGQLLHGLFESFYASKQLCEKGSYAKGLKNGVWQAWRPDGTLIRTEHWKNGTQRGEQIAYSATGEVQKRTLIHGRKTTTECGDTLIEINGKSRKVTLMDSLGRVQSIARYKNSLLHGKQETIAADGSKTVTSYKNGVASVAKTKEPKTENTTEPKAKKHPFKRLKERFSKKEKATSDPSSTKKEKAPKEPKAKKPAKETTPASTGEQQPEEKKKLHPFKRKGA